MIEKFKNGPSDPPFEDPQLNLHASNSSALINFTKTFSKLLNTELQKSNGDINSISPINMGDIRPIFNGWYNKFGGLQILVNDTEQTNIRLKDYSIDANGNWSANIVIEITDHFGLDRNDAINYEYKNGGFAAWWVLQHRRNYKPFITKIYVTKKIGGKL